jgi:hypothetical protein
MDVDILELEQQYVDKKITKAELFRQLSLYLRNLRGREYDQAAKKVMTLCDKLDLGITAFRKISRMY